LGLWREAYTPSTEIRRAGEALHKLSLASRYVSNKFNWLVCDDGFKTRGACLLQDRNTRHVASAKENSLAVVRALGVTARIMHLAGALRTPSLAHPNSLRWHRSLLWNAKGATLRLASGGACRPSRPRAELFRYGGRHYLVLVGGLNRNQLSSVQPITFAVELQNAVIMSEPVEQRARETLALDNAGPFLERQI
jgi:hypothetical protein